jgi:hypothetical protein
VAVEEVEWLTVCVPSTPAVPVGAAEAPEVTVDATLGEALLLPVEDMVGDQVTLTRGVSVGVPSADTVFVAVLLSLP